MCQEVLAIPKACKISVFESKNYKVSVSDVLNTLCMSTIICFYDTGTGPSLMRADVLKASRLRNIFQRDMPEIWSASDTWLSVSETIKLHLRMR